MICSSDAVLGSVRRKTKGVSGAHPALGAKLKMGAKVTGRTANAVAVRRRDTLEVGTCSPADPTMSVEWLISKRPLYRRRKAMKS